MFTDQELSTIYVRVPICGPKLTSYSAVPPGALSIENDADDIEKLLLKNSSKLNKFLHSEVNQIIQHIQFYV